MPLYCHAPPVHASPARRTDCASRTVRTSQRARLSQVWMNGLPASMHRWRRDPLPFSCGRYNTARCNIERGEGVGQARRGEARRGEARPCALFASVLPTMVPLRHFATHLVEVESLLGCNFVHRLGRGDGQQQLGRELGRVCAAVVGHAPAQELGIAPECWRLDDGFEEASLEQDQLVVVRRREVERAHASGGGGKLLEIV